MEVGAYQPSTRADFFNLGNHGGQTLHVSGTDDADEIAYGCDGLRLPFDFFRRNGDFLGDDFFCFGSEDFTENADHGWLSI